MKKIILTLTLLLSFGLNYGINPIKMNNSNKSFLNDDLLTSLINTNDFGLTKVAKASEILVNSTCDNLALSVATAAFESGESLQTTLKMFYDVKTVCEVLMGLGAVINAAE